MQCIYTLLFTRDLSRRWLSLPRCLRIVDGFLLFFCSPPLPLFFLFAIFLSTSSPLLFIQNTLTLLNDAKYFDDTSTRFTEMRKMLDSSDGKEKLEAMKRLLAVCVSPHLFFCSSLSSCCYRNNVPY